MGKTTFKKVVYYCIEGPNGLDNYISLSRENAIAHFVGRRGIKTDKGIIGSNNQKELLEYWKNFYSKEFKVVKLQIQKIS